MNIAAFFFCLFLALGSVASKGEFNPVLDWNAAMMEAIRAETTGPTASTRNLAILHCAIFDAVNSITRTHKPWRFQIDCPPGASVEAAVVAGGEEIMRSLYPSSQGQTAILGKKLRAALPDNPATASGLAVGKEAAVRVLTLRSADGSNTQVPYIPKSTPGQWRRTGPFFRPPIDPHWGFVTPFALPDTKSFLPPPPPDLGGEAYAAAFNEVKAIGSKDSQVRTAEQSQIAVFWSDFSYTAMPPGHWQEIAAQLARARRISVADTARLFALLSLAQADAGIVCWQAKYLHNLWRPVTAIRRADEDNNPATEKDEKWDSHLICPSFPEYISGHSTFSKASAQTLAFFFGGDALEFTVKSDSLPNVTRSFRSLAACVDEVGMSRIYGGIHFQFGNAEGKKCGAKIGDYVCAHCLLPVKTNPKQ